MNETRIECGDRGWGMGRGRGSIEGYDRCLSGRDATQSRPYLFAERTKRQLGQPAVLTLPATGGATGTRVCMWTSTFARLGKRSRQRETT